MGLASEWITKARVVATGEHYTVTGKVAISGSGARPEAVAEWNKWAAE